MLEEVFCPQFDSQIELLFLLGSNTTWANSVLKDVQQYHLLASLTCIVCFHTITIAYRFDLSNVFK